MFIRTPTSVMNIISDVPPELKKGSETPVGGTEAVTVATFSKLCIAMSDVIPIASRLPNMSGR